MHTAPGRTGSTSAFTLIETMLALVIVTMLATLVVPSLLSLRADATTDRAKAEIAAALSDARSLARARSMPVIVSLAAPDASGESEITGTVLSTVNDIATNLDAASAASPDENTDDPADEPAAAFNPAEPQDDFSVTVEPSPAPTVRRLGILPGGCRLAYSTGADLKADTKNDATPEPKFSSDASAMARSTSVPATIMLAMVFPDGTASVPRRSLELTVSAARSKPRVFAVRLSTWFAEATFSEIFPFAETTTDTPSPDAAVVDAEASMQDAEVPR